MPDGRLQRTREAYRPQGAERVDAYLRALGSFEEWRVDFWRAPHENAADRLIRRAYDTDRDPGDECDAWARSTFGD